MFIQQTETLPPNLRNAIHEQDTPEPEQQEIIQHTTTSSAPVRTHLQLVKDEEEQWQYIPGQINERTGTSSALET